jgi:rhodanese-related sulfurtransferase
VTEVRTDVAQRATIGELLEAARGRLKRLEPSAAQAALADGALLIDTRSPDQRRENGVIPGSVHIPLSVLFWRLDPTSESADHAMDDPTRTVILICAHGYSSSLAAATLHDLGYAHATDVIGGFEAWAAAGLQVRANPD